MILVLGLLILVAVAVVVTGAASLGRTIQVVLVVVGGLVVLLGVVTVGIGSLRSAGDHEDGADEPAPTVGPEVPERAEPAPARRGIVGVGRRPVDVVLDPIEASERSFPAPAPIVDELHNRETILFELHGPEAASMHQCALGPGGQPTVCDVGIPVRAPFDAPAIGLVQVHASFVVRGETVDCRRRSCGIVALTEDGGNEVVAVAELVFGRPASTPQLLPDRTRRLHPGDEIVVRVHGIDPGEEVGVTWCAPPGRTEDCGAPGPVATAVADDAGRATARLRVPEGRIGAGQRTCGRGDPCAVALVGGARSATVVPIDYAGVPGADVPLSRVLPAVALAAVLAGAALVVVRRRETTMEIADPFAGVSLEVPEWEGVVIDEVPEWDELWVSR